VVHGGVKFEQTLVHRTELFNIQRGVVDTTWMASRVFLIPGERPEGIEQVTIGEGEGVETLRGEEFAVEWRELEKSSKSFVAQHLPEHAERLPEVVVLGKGSAVLKQPSQPGGAVVLAIDGIRTQQPAVLRHEQKEEAVH
jgi:hypothetical protein